MSPREHARRRAGLSASLGALVVAALMPKCPLCVAALLATLGVGAALRLPLAELAQPLLLALALVALVVLARRRGRQECEERCGRSGASLP